MKSLEKPKLPEPEENAIGMFFYFSAPILRTYDETCCESQDAAYSIAQ
jgi:hypothetical protein